MNIDYSKSKCRMCDGQLRWSPDYPDYVECKECGHYDFKTEEHQKLIDLAILGKTIGVKSE